MPDALQIRARLADWLDGKISLSEFEDWFVPETWNIHKAADPEAEELVDKIELSLSEYSGGYLSPAQLRESLGELVAAAHPFVLSPDAIRWPSVTSDPTKVVPWKSGLLTSVNETIGVGSVHQSLSRMSDLDVEFSMAVS